MMESISACSVISIIQILMLIIAVKKNQEVFYVCQYFFTAIIYFAFWKYISCRDFGIRR